MTHYNTFAFSLFPAFILSAGAVHLPAAAQTAAGSAIDATQSATGTATDRSNPATTNKGDITPSVPQDADQGLEDASREGLGIQDSTGNPLNNGDTGTSGSGVLSNDTDADADSDTDASADSSTQNGDVTQEGDVRSGSTGGLDSRSNTDGINREGNNATRPSRGLNNDADGSATGTGSTGTEASGSAGSR